MSKKSYLVSVFILISLIIGIIKTTKPSTNYITTDRLSIISNKPIELPIAKIIIPKIGIDGEIYNINSRENDVDKNITILKESIFPNHDNSIIFLAAHSGEGKIAYFNDLDKLKTNDIVIFQYKDKNYYYSINQIFEEDKDGDIEIIKTSNKQLVLTTCSRKDKRKQLIVNSNFIKKEEIT